MGLIKTFHWIASIYAGLFGIMTAVNEYVRSTVKAHSYTYVGKPTIHPDASVKNRCTWKCHNMDFQHA